MIVRYILALLFISNFVFSQDKIQTALEFQNELNSNYSDSTKSPLMKEDLKVFKGLDFFTINEKYIVKATFKRTKKEKPFRMKTTTSRTPMYKKYGVLSFEIDGVSYQLNVYQSLELKLKPGYEDYLFLPFTDLTCGKESYIGGRYLDLRIPNSKEIVIDFNKAYNPYCAYNYKYSCPIVPLENDLNIDILAGVKKFHD